MRLHHFFVEGPIRENESFLVNDRDLIHQWKNVFRFQVGHRLILLDNSSYEFIAQIVLLTSSKAELDIISSRISATAPKIELTLCTALIKKDNFEWVLEKGTEIGVSHFIPVLAEKSEKKSFNEERALKIIKEATEQSQRAKLPVIFPTNKTADAIKLCKERGIELIIALDPTGTEKFDKGLISENKDASKKDIPSKIALFIGPEGGWSIQELQTFKNESVKICTFGAAILRAETAAVVSAGTLLL